MSVTRRTGPVGVDRARCRRVCIKARFSSAVKSESRPQLHQVFGSMFIAGQILKGCCMAEASHEPMPHSLLCCCHGSYFLSSSKRGCGATAPAAVRVGLQLESVDADDHEDVPAQLRHLVTNLAEHLRRRAGNPSARHLARQSPV